MLKFRSLIIFIALSFFFDITGQNNDVLDSLHQELPSVNDSLKSELYLKIVYEYYKSRQKDSIFKYAEPTIRYGERYKDYKALSTLYNLLAKVYSRQDQEKSMEYFTRSLEMERKRSDTLRLLDRLMVIAEYSTSLNPKQSIIYADEFLDLSKKAGDSASIAKANAILGVNYYYTGDYNSAIKYWEESLELYEVLNDKNQVGTMLTNIGVIYKNWGDYQEAIKYYQQNLELQEEIGDSLLIARALSNMGNIHYYMGIDFHKALNYYKRSLSIFKHLDNRVNEANNLNNIGLVYRELGQEDEALSYFKQALEIFTDINSRPGIASANNNIGNVYLEEGNFKDALKYSRIALEINKETGNKKETASNLRDIGRVYFKLDKYREALDYYYQSLELNNELGHKREVYEIYKDISTVHEELGNFRTALKNYKQYNDLKDSSISEEYLKQISELETKYETEKKEREIELQRSQLAEKEAEAMAQRAEINRKEAEVKRQRVLLFSFILGLIIVGVFSQLLHKQMKEKQRVNVQLEKQNLEIKKQRDKIFQQKKEITDSIHYASRIQKAILPPENILSNNLSDHFILNLPRDIVSGDFYWMTESDNKTIVVAADCTGHGVPGAFMSLLGVTFLNEIVKKDRINTASGILNELRNNVVSSLHQTGQEGEANDGMDVALVVIDHDKMQMEYAGAYNPLFLFRNGELTEHQADKMPIGIHFQRNGKFSNNLIDIRKNDTIYIFSDGFIDQFGGKKGKKFMSRNFKKLLSGIQNLSLREQKQVMFSTFQEWKSDVEQIDDVLIIGMKI